MRLYLDLVKKEKKLGDRDPRHVLGYMMLGINHFSNCTDSEWNREFKIACGCVDQVSKDDAEANAKSFGL